MLIGESGREKAAVVTADIGIRFLESRRGTPQNEEQVRQESKSPTVHGQKPALMSALKPLRTDVNNP
jgi:hypothetical protein